MSSSGAPGVCRGCGKPITSNYISLGSAAVRYHSECFACTGCRKALTSSGQGKDESVHSIHMRDDRPFCGACWQERFAERCSVCRAPFAPRERLVSHGGKKLHAFCFNCSSCASPLAEAGVKHINEGGRPFCGACHAQQFCPRCTVCSKPIAAGNPYVTLDKGRQRLHKECFRCSSCQKPLVATGGGSHYEHEGAVFCAEDFARLHGQACSICAKRLLSWITGPLGELYCPSHATELPSCHACGRLVAAKSGGTDIADGRSTCAACAATAVHRLEEARALLQRVHAFLIRLGLQLPPAADVPLQLCDRSELLARNSDQRSRHRSHRCPLGLTCAREMQHETQYVCLPVGSKWPTAHPQPQPPPLRRMESKRSIDSLCVLSGLPAGLCASTLAHELGHVSLHLNDFDLSLPPPVAEGVCELLAYLWLTDGGEASKLGESDAERQARISCMLKSSDQVYGQGFRDALAAYYAVGSSLPRLLQELKLTKRLPTTPAKSPTNRLVPKGPRSPQPPAQPKPAAPGAAAHGFARAVAR